MYKIIGGDGKEYGPVSTEQLRAWVREGRATLQTLAQAEGSADWKPLSAFPEFAASAAAPVPVVPSGRPSTAVVPNYLVQAILVTLCCCMPFGIPAIVFAAQVNTKLAAGDIPGAQESSDKAKKWCWVAFWLGLVANLIGAGLGIIGALAG